MRVEAAGILFDSDGVLVDSHDQVQEAWRQLATEYDLDVDSLLVELVGKRSADTLRRHVPGNRLDVVVARLEDLEVEAASATRAVAGALELLDALPPRSWTIVTSASRRLALARWRGAAIPVPAEVVTAENVTAGKPDPEPFLAGAKLLGIEVNRCVIFEDSAPGGLAGAAAEATVVAVGAQPWPEEPVARVDDLAAVTLDTGTFETVTLDTVGRTAFPDHSGGSLVFELRPSLG